MTRLMQALQDYFKFNSKTKISGEKDLRIILTFI